MKRQQPIKKPNNFLSFYDEEIEALQILFGQCLYLSNKKESQMTMIQINQLKQNNKKFVNFIMNILQWINQIRKQDLKEVFSIRNGDNVENIVRLMKKIRQIEHAQQVQIGGNYKLPSPDQSEWRIDHDWIKIAWISKPIIFAEPTWAMSNLETMLKIYCVEKSKQNTCAYILFKNKRKCHELQALEDEDPYNVLHKMVVIYLIQAIIEVHETGIIPSNVHNIESMKNFSVNIQSSPELYMRRIFGMTISQAVYDGDLRKYQVVGQGIEEKYFARLATTAVNMIENQPEPELSKKAKKKKKKANQADKRQEQPGEMQQKQKIKPQIAQQKPQSKISKSKATKELKVEEHSNIITPILPMQSQYLESNIPVIKMQEQINSQVSRQIDPRFAKHCTLLAINQFLQKQLHFIQQQNNRLSILKHTAIQLLNQFLEFTYPVFKISMFGSLFTSTSLPNSDIDLILTHMNNERIGQEFLEQISSRLLDELYVTFTDPIATAKVPVIKVIVDPTAISNPSTYKSLQYEEQIEISYLVKFDLTFNTANGTSTGLLSTDYILNIVSNLPKLREIFILIKTIFNVANLNEGYKGGFSSYSLFTMLISFAEEKQIDLQRMPLGELLLSFFEFFAREFNPNCSVLRFEKGYPSVINFEEYKKLPNAQALSKNSKFKILQPIGSRLIQASYSRYDQMKELFEGGLQSVAEIQESSFPIIERLINEGIQDEKVIEQIVSQQLVESLPMKTFSGLFFVWNE